jgi:hypothetical protein
MKNIIKIIGILTITTNLTEASCLTSENEENYVSNLFSNTNILNITDYSDSINNTASFTEYISNNFREHVEVESNDLNAQVFENVSSFSSTQQISEMPQGMLEIESLNSQEVTIPCQSDLVIPEKLITPAFDVAIPPHFEFTTVEELAATLNSIKLYYQYKKTNHKNCFWKLQKEYENDLSNEQLSNNLLSPICKLIRIESLEFLHLNLSNNNFGGSIEATLFLQEAVKDL